MKSNVESWNGWYRRLMEARDPEKTEFGLEGGGKHGVIMCQHSKWSGGKWTGAERYWGTRGETRPSRGQYDQLVYYSPDEFEGWETGPQFEDYDTRGLRWYWKDLSRGGEPVVILVPGSGEVVDHKSPEYIAYEEIYRDMASIPEFQKIMQAKQAGKLGNIPKEVIASLKSKAGALRIEDRARDVFDRTGEQETEWIKGAVKRNWSLGLV
jgi:hypothetical protein